MITSASDCPMAVQQWALEHTLAPVEHAVGVRHDGSLTETIIGEKYRVNVLCLVCTEVAYILHTHPTGSFKLSSTDIAFSACHQIPIVSVGRTEDKLQWCGIWGGWKPEIMFLISVSMRGEVDISDYKQLGCSITTWDTQVESCAYSESHTLVTQSAM